MADSIYGLLKYPSMSKHLKKEGKTEAGKMKWDNSARQVRKIYRDVLIKSKVKV
jgi:hypothetical protein